MTRRGRAADKQLRLLLVLSGDETTSGERKEDTPGGEPDLMEQVLEGENLRAALRQVHRNGGGSGGDGMTVDDLVPYLTKHWPTLRVSLLDGSYRPHPVKRVEVPEPEGGVER